MRKILLLLLILAFPFLCNAQMVGRYTKTIHLSYNAEHFTFEENDGLLHILSDSLIGSFSSDTLAPAMPYYPVNVLIKPNEQYVNYYATTSSEMEIMDSVLMSPNELAIPTDMPASPRRVREVAYAPAVYPTAFDCFEALNTTDGYNYLSFLICPFRYDSATGKLYLKTGIDLNIRLKVFQSPQFVNANFASNKESLKQTIVNNNEFGDGYVDHSGFIHLDSLLTFNPINQSDSTDIEVMDYRYLIVTNEILRPTFQRLADWKTTKGVRAKVITVEEIDSLNTSSDTLQLKIKKAVKNYYNGEYQGLQYLLLGGDDNIVPAIKCDLYYSTSDSTYHSRPPVDLYYSCMDAPLNWDANGNGIYAETGNNGDNIDLKPEFAVSRISVKTINDAEKIIDRIIHYESTQGMWSQKILMAGDYRVFQYPPKVPIKTAYYTGMAECSANDLYNTFIQNNWNGQRDQFFETYTNIDNGNFSFDYLNFNRLLSRGYPFVNVDTHGTEISKLLVFNEHVYSKSVIDTLNNIGNTVFVTSACNTNDFTVEDWRECQSEYLLRSPNSGILAYIGGAAKGWMSGGCSIGASQRLNGLFFKKILTNKNNHLGEALSYAKSTLSGTNGNSIGRWLTLSVMIMGDPEMPVFTSEPLRFDSVQVSFRNDSLIVTPNAKGCKVCVMSDYDNGNEYYEVRYDDINYALQPNLIKSFTFTPTTNHYRVCVTKGGYIPYIFHVRNSEFIQNETFETDTRIVGNNIQIGRNVTSLIDEGAVVIESGKTTVSYSGEVFIKNSFEVKKGAEFVIEKLD